MFLWQIRDANLTDNFNPIPPELWNDVITWGGAFCARTDFRLSKLTKRPPSTQNLLSNEYFDLYLSIDTKNSPLYSILMPLQAAEWRRSKLKIFKPKKVKIENFELQKRYIPQNKAENIYNSVSAQKRKNFCKKKIFLKFFWFSRHARGPPEIFDVQFFKNLKTNPKMALLGSIKHWKEQIHEFWWT